MLVSNASTFTGSLTGMAPKFDREVTSTVSARLQYNSRVGRYLQLRDVDPGQDFNMCELRLLTDPLESKSIGRRAYQEDPHQQTFAATDGSTQNAYGDYKQYTTTDDMETVDLGSVKRVNRVILIAEQILYCKFVFLIDNHLLSSLLFFSSTSQFVRFVRWQFN